MTLFYADDGYMFDHHSAVRHFLSHLNSAEATRAGIHLRVDKCKLWWCVAPSPTVHDSYRPELPQEYSAETSILRTFIGDDIFVTNALRALVAALRPVL